MTRAGARERSRGGARGRRETGLRLTKRPGATANYIIAMVNAERQHTKASVARMIAGFERRKWITTAQANRLDHQLRRDERRSGTIRRKLWALRDDNGFGPMKPADRARALRAAMRRARA